MTTAGREYFHNAMAAIAMGLGNQPLLGRDDSALSDVVRNIEAYEFPEIRRRVEGSLTTAAMECARIPQANLGWKSACEYLEHKADELVHYLDMGMFYREHFEEGTSQTSLALEDSLRFAFGISLAMADRVVGPIALGPRAVSNLHCLEVMARALTDPITANAVIAPLSKAGFGIIGNTYMVQDDRRLPAVAALALALPTLERPRRETGRNWFGRRKRARASARPASLFGRDAVTWVEGTESAVAVDGRSPRLDADIQAALARTMTQAGHLSSGRDGDSTVVDERSSGCPVHQLPGNVKRTSATKTGVEMSIHFAGLALQDVIAARRSLVAEGCEPKERSREAFDSRSV